MTSATEVVIFAIACMALNILVGHTGLVSFGHGAWFGLAAYAAACSSATGCPGGFSVPTIAGVAHRRGGRVAFGFLILRRRGRLFLAADTGAGRHDLCRRLPLDRGDRRRGRPRRHHAAALFGFDFESLRQLLLVRGGNRIADRLIVLWRFHRSTGRQRAGRHPRERAARAFPRLSDQPLQAASPSSLSAALTGLAGMLLLFNNRMTSADPISVAVLRRIAGDGRDRRHAQLPRAGARRAVLRDLPRLSLERHARTGCSGSACCSSPSSCSRRPVSSASASGCSRPFRKKVVEDAAMSARGRPARCRCRSS